MEEEFDFKELANMVTEAIIENAVVMIELEREENYEEAQIINDAIDNIIDVQSDFYQNALMGDRENFFELLKKQKEYIIKKIRENL